MGRQDDMQPAEVSPTKLTYDDYLLFPDDGRRHELIDGEHHVTPAPSLRHQRILRRLTTAFDVFLQTHRLGEVFCAPVDVVPTDVDVVEPDVLFVSNERAAILRDPVRGAPDLVIEILSPSSRRTDEIVKRKLYERIGVREYWVVDPELDAVKVYRRDGEKFARGGEFSREEGHSLSTPLLPGLSIPLDDLFR
ncbi:MAG: Uma2 family endonuclease [Acidobacteria bacterium]|nr:Uma2 family endonuclease [Acidobacteriota bacterium]